MKSFNISLNINNTFASTKYQHLGVAYGQITNNKFWELEHYIDTDNILILKLQFKSECDHAGFEFVVGCLGYTISFHIYDSRHWNKKENCWESYFV